jgi:hypothetical protein
MATTTTGDVRIYEEQFQGGFIETVQQNIEGFNAASAGTLVMRARELLGRYEQEAFWDEVVAGKVERRNPASESSSTVSPAKLTQDEFVGVKLDRRNGPYEVNIDSFRKIGETAAAQTPGGNIPGAALFSRVIGTQTARAMPQEQLNRALSALVGKLAATAGLFEDQTGASHIKTGHLAKTLARFGDASGQVGMWVMHSQAYWQLVESQIVDAIYRADGVQIVQGTPATLGRPVLVTDSPALVIPDGVSTGVDQHYTLGLAPSAAVLDISAPPIAVMEGPLTGSDNLFLRWQAEYSYNLRLRGCRWNISGGGANPDNGAVASGANWVTSVADAKLLPGVALRTKAGDPSSA